MPLPAVITSASGIITSQYRHARHGPFANGSNLYVLLRDTSSGSGATPGIVAFKSTDGGESWSEVDRSPIAVSLALTAAVLHVEQSGMDLIVALTDNSSIPKATICVFSMSSDTFTTDVVAGSSSASGYRTPSGYFVRAFKMSNGNIRVFFHYRRAVMGVDYHRPATLFWDGSGWSSTTYVQDSTDQINWYIEEVIQNGDSFRVLFRESGSATLQQRVVTGTTSTTVGAASNVLTDLSTTANYAVPGSTLLTRGGTTYEAFAYLDSSNVLKSRVLVGGTWSAAATISDATIEHIVNAALIDDGGGPDTLYALWASADQSSLDSDTEAGTTTTLSWGTDSQLWSASTSINHISATVLTGAIGVVYLDGTAITYNEHAFSTGPTTHQGASSASQGQSATSAAWSRMDGSVTASQGQTATASAHIVLPGSATASQGQTADSAATVHPRGAAAASQGQSATSVAFRHARGAAAATQGQTTVAAGARGLLAAASVSQGQTATASAGRVLPGSATASQAQSAATTGAGLLLGGASASQGQSATSSGVLIGGAETHQGASSASQGQTATSVASLSGRAATTASQGQSAVSAGTAHLRGIASASQGQSATTDSVLIGGAETQQGAASATQGQSATASATAQRLGQAESSQAQSAATGAWLRTLGVASAAQTQSASASAGRTQHAASSAVQDETAATLARLRARGLAASVQSETATTLARLHLLATSSATQGQSATTVGSGRAPDPDIAGPTDALDGGDGRVWATATASGRTQTTATLTGRTRTTATHDGRTQTTATRSGRTRVYEET